MGAGVRLSPRRAGLYLPWPGSGEGQTPEAGETITRGSRPKSPRPQRQTAGLPESRWRL